MLGLGHYSLFSMGFWFLDARWGVVGIIVWVWECGMTRTGGFEVVVVTVLSFVCKYLVMIPNAYWSVINNKCVV